MAVFPNEPNSAIGIDKDGFAAAMHNDHLQSPFRIEIWREVTPDPVSPRQALRYRILIPDEVLGCRAPARIGIGKEMRIDSRVTAIAFLKLQSATGWTESFARLEGR